MKAKKCTRCGVRKPLTEYYRRAHTDTWYSWCKQCTKRQQKPDLYCRRCKTRKPRAEFEAGKLTCRTCQSKPKPNGRRKNYNPELHPPGRGSGDICYRCKGLPVCRERVKYGLWVLCEVPDQWDKLWVSSWVPEEVQERLLSSLA